MYIKDLKIGDLFRDTNSNIAMYLGIMRILFPTSSEKISAEECKHTAVFISRHKDKTKNTETPLEIYSWPIGEVNVTYLGSYSEVRPLLLGAIKTLFE